MNHISTMDIFKKAWEIVRLNFVKIVGATVILFVIQAILDSVSGGGKNTSPEGGIVSLAATIVSLIVGVAVTAAMIRIARGAPVELQALSVTTSQVFRYIGVIAILMLIFVAIALPFFGLALSFGAISLIGTNLDLNAGSLVAFIFVALLVLMYVNFRLMFATYLVVDKNVGVFKAIKQSWNITKGQLVTLIKLVLISAGVAILGALALLVGLFVAVPVIAFAYALFYLLLITRFEKSAKKA